MNNNMKLEFLAISDNEKFARTAVAAFITQLNPTLDDIEDVKAAVSEAVTNSIIHGYKNISGNVYITCTLRESEAEIVISDKGCGIENIELARTPLYTGSKDSERSGLGFTVMETFMDAITVESVPDKGTTVTLVKKINSPSPSSL
ncbi:MAG: anti-sigma F factor [Clostridia bacterium]|nr:anti-sigma F factor [Clostridia bacterium]